MAAAAGSARVALVGWLALSSGCGGPRPGDAGDAGSPVDGGSLADGDSVTAPSPPALTPCPAGWREAVSTTAVTSCEPYPAGGPATCPAGEAHFPGEPGCAPVGSSCPKRDFADDLPADGSVLFVLVGASGGDGTRALPFATIAEALARAGAGTTIAVGRGRYGEAVSLRSGVILRGACAAGTVLAPVGPDPRPGVVNVAGAGVIIRDLTIGPSDRAGITATGSSTEAQLDGVVVERVTRFGLFVREGARMTARALVVRETQADAAGLLGRGLDVDLSGTFDATRAIFERNREAGIFAGPASSLALADVAVRDTGAQPSDGSAGDGLFAVGGASARVSRAIFERNRHSGVFADGAGTVLVLTDTIVRDTQSLASSGDMGRGIYVASGATGEASRVVVDGNRDVAVWVGGAGAALVLTDAVVRDTGSRQSTGRFGRGLSVEHGGSAMVGRALFERNREIAVRVGSAGSLLVLTDVVVRDTASQEVDGNYGRGLNIDDGGATAEVTRLLLERNREIGVFAHGPGTRATLTDVVVRETLPNAIGLGGIGAGSYSSASLTLERFVVTVSAFAGVQLARDGTVDLHHGEVSEGPIGVNVQTAGFDLARLMDGVVYRDNLRDLVAEELPVPEPGLPIGDR